MKDFAATARTKRPARTWLQRLNAVGMALLCVLVLAAASAAESKTIPDRLPSPSTDTDTEELGMLIKHLSAEELEHEADRWQALLRQNIYDLNQAKIELRRENLQIQELEQETQSEQKTSDPAESSPELDAKAAKKAGTLESLAGLREKRIQIIDRMNVVLDELSTKLGRKSKEEEHDTVMKYRQYIDSVEGLQLDVTDTQSTRSAVISWAESSEGGRRLLRHLMEFIGIVVGFWVLGALLSRAVSKVLDFTGRTSQITRKFIVDTVRRGLLAVGLLLGLAALELDITPLVAVIGAAGFVIAFALQDTLSNFASGLMIMFYEPFDLEDYIETSEVRGKIKSMTLMTTKVMTPDNKLMIVPNNSLWGQVITNVTGSQERRVDLVFGIGYGDDIGKAEQVLTEALAGHPLVLKEPEPVIRVSELGESSVNLICRPWVKTPDYWTVYWDLTRVVKERFDEAGISIPFPQRDVHIHNT